MKITLKNTTRCTGKIVLIAILMPVLQSIADETEKKAQQTIQKKSVAEKDVIPPVTIFGERGAVTALDGAEPNHKILMFSDPEYLVVLFWYPTEESALKKMDEFVAKTAQQNSFLTLGKAVTTAEGVKYYPGNLMGMRDIIYAQKHNVFMTVSDDGGLGAKKLKIAFAKLCDYYDSKGTVVGQATDKTAAK